jgi:PIN domain nuclease of toxin-antitoxin system
MRLLLDTHAFLWWLFDSKELSRKARKAIEDKQNEVLVSAATAFEIETKHRIGKLPSARALTGDLSGWIARAGFAELSMSVAHAAKAGAWPQAHRDPFDRMLAAQGHVEGCPLVTCDPQLAGFDVAILW